MTMRKDVVLLYFTLIHLGASIPQNPHPINRVPFFCKYEQQGNISRISSLYPLAPKFKSQALLRPYKTWYTQLELCISQSGALGGEPVLKAPLSLLPTKKADENGRN